MSDSDATFSNGDTKKETLLEGLGLVALGGYLVLFTLAIVAVIWQAIPSCDVVGFVVTRLSPVQALTTGGQQVRVFGEGFQRDVTVRVGDKAATASVISPFEIAVTTPQLPAGRVAVTVTQSGFPSMNVPGGLEYVAGPVAAPPPAAAAPSAVFQINTIDPSSAHTGGGEAVTITGTGFMSNMTVRFGGVPARSVQVDGPRFITAVTPMHAPGAVSVIVGNDQSLNSLDGKFSFACPAAPDRTMVLMVLLAGALGGLVHALRSFFWYAGEQKLLWNWMPMYLLLPFSSSALGFVFYLVIRAGLYQPTAGTSYLLVGLAALVGMFSAQATEKLKAIAEGIFTKAPQGANPAPPADAASKASVLTVSGIKPGFGPVAGGTVVTIVGTGFTPQSVVRFDQTVSPKTIQVNATTLKAVAPPRGSPGVVDLAVKVGDKEAMKPYTYMTPKGNITDVNPKEGGSTGGTKITIKGGQFAGDVAVSFGEALGAAPKIIDASTIEVTTPAQPAGKVDVRVDAGTDLVAVAPGAFEYKQ